LTRRIESDGFDEATTRGASAGEAFPPPARRTTVVRTNNEDRIRIGGFAGWRFRR
jgi:hypothetical protein